MRTNLLDSLKTGRIVRGHDAESTLLYIPGAGTKPNVASDGQLYDGRLRRTKLKTLHNQSPRFSAGQ